MIRLSGLSAWMEFYRGKREQDVWLMGLLRLLIGFWRVTWPFGMLGYHKICSLPGVVESRRPQQ